MDLNIQDWKEFQIGRVFKTNIAKSVDYSNTEAGDNLYIGRTSENNGVQGKVLNQPVEEGNCIIIGMVGENWAFYQTQPFVASQNIFVLRNKHLNHYTAMFLCSVLNKCVEVFRDTYSLPLGKEKMNVRNIKLPIKYNLDGSPDIDMNKVYSDYGYLPDWDFMERYIKTLNCEPLTTKNREKGIFDLNTANWKEFYLKDLFDCCMGNGIDASATTDYEPVYNYVSRDSKGNGVVNFVDEVKKTDKRGNVISEKPFQAGTMTLALGGSFLGSCFVQKEPYYTAQNVAVLTEKEPLTIQTKIFISTLVRNECKYKYIAFGRELNTHYKTDFSIKLPVKTDEKGQPVIDETHTYSEKGYIPDWQFMNDYINGLPYSDRI